MEKITNRQQLEDSIKMWTRINLSRVHLFNNPRIEDGKTSKKEKLDYYTKILKNSRGLTGDAKQLRRYLKDEVLKLEVELQPIKLFRVVERLTRPLRKAMERESDRVANYLRAEITSVIAAVKENWKASSANGLNQQTAQNVSSDAKQDIAKGEKLQGENNSKLNNTNTANQDVKLDKKEDLLPPKPTNEIVPQRHTSVNDPVRQSLQERNSLNKSDEGDGVKLVIKNRHRLS